MYPEISVDVSYGHGFYESKERSNIAGLEKLTLFLHHVLPMHQGMYLYRIYIPTVRPIYIDTRQVDKCSLIRGRPKKLL